MCDQNCLIWGLENISIDEVQGKCVLEIGSCDVNGTLRYGIERMNPSEYVGVDICEGRGVDKIVNCEDLVSEFGENSFDFVFSTCLLEHVKDWRLCVSQIKRVCADSGYILTIVPYLYPYHEYPNDFWRFSKSDLIYIFRDCEVIKIDHDYEIQIDEHGKQTPLSLIYMKCRKQVPFNECDLSSYEVKKMEQPSNAKRP